MKNICAECQKARIANCSHFDNCGCEIIRGMELINSDGSKTPVTAVVYPVELKINEPRYTWRLIQCFRGSSEKYDTIEYRSMTACERDKAQSEQNKVDGSKQWVR